MTRFDAYFLFARDQVFLEQLFESRHLLQELDGERQKRPHELLIRLRADGRALDEPPQIAGALFDGLDAAANRREGIRDVREGAVHVALNLQYLDQPTQHGFRAAGAQEERLQTLLGVAQLRVIEQRML